MKIIPYGRQHTDQKDISIVAKILKKDKITTGNLVNQFEDKINKFLRCKYSTVCNSGTSALYLALSAIGVKKKDKIIMPSINFIASYNISKLLGAEVYLADVDKFTGQMKPQDVLSCIKKYKLKKVKAIITMYNGGYPENSELFYKFKKKFNCYIIEDACHAFGSEYLYKKKFLKIGSCKHADLSTFSLHPLKSITTGEGGIVTTNSKIIDKKIKILRSLGIKKNPKYHWKYDVIYYGLNYRLTDFQCALGISQLNKIKKFILARKKISDKYTKELKKIPDIIIPSYNKKYKSSYHLYLVCLKNKNIKLKDKFIKFMLKNKIILQYHYIPIYKFKVFRDKFDCKEAEWYYKTTVSLPIHYNLTSKQQNYIISKLKFFFKKNLIFFGKINSK